MGSPSPIFGSPSMFTPDDSYDAYLRGVQEVKQLLETSTWDFDKTGNWKETMDTATRWSERFVEVLKDPDLVSGADRATLLFKLAVWKFEKGHYRESLNTHLEARKIYPESIDNSTAIGNCYMVLGQHEKALEFFDPEKNHVSMGNYYRSQKKYAEALLSYEKALQNAEDWVVRFKVYNNMGIIYSLQSQPAQALEKYQQAEKLAKTIFPHNHPDVAANLNNIGSYHYSMKDYTTALEYYGKALRMRLDLLDPHHLDIASSWRNTGNAYAAQGKIEQALENYRKAYDILKQTLGNKHPDIIAVLAAIGSCSLRY